VRMALTHTDGRTDRQTQGMKKVVDNFSQKKRERERERERERVNAPKGCRAKSVFGQKYVVHKDYTACDFV